MPFFHCTKSPAMMCFCSQYGDKPQVESEIVYARDLHGKQLLRLEKVVQIRLCRDAVYLATAVFVNRREVHLPFLVAHVHRALIGEEHGVASVVSASRSGTYPHSSLNALKDVLRSAYSHQVTWLVLGQNLVNHLYHLIHITSVGSPTAKPPIALPSAPLSATYWRPLA